MDLSRCFNDAIAVYQKNWVILFLAAFLFQILSLLSLLVLCGPLYGGVCLMMIGALTRENKVVDLGDMFRPLAFSKPGGFVPFLRLLGLFVVTTILVLLGLAIELGPSLVPYIGIVIGWFVSPIAWLIVASAYIQQVHEDEGDLSDLFGEGAD